MEYYNILKKELTDRKKTKTSWQLPDDPWKAESKRLKIKLSEALINSESRRLLSKQSTPSTFSSQTFRSSIFLRNCKKFCYQKLLKWEVLDTKIFMTLSRHISTFFGKCFGCAHFYVFKICKVSCHRYTFLCYSSPNELVAVCTLVWDWRGDATVSVAFMICNNTTRSGFRVLGNPSYTTWRLLLVMEQ